MRTPQREQDTGDASRADDSLHRGCEDVVGARRAVGGVAERGKGGCIADFAERESCVLANLWLRVVDEPAERRDCRADSALCGEFAEGRGGGTTDCWAFVATEVDELGDGAGVASFAKGHGALAGLFMLCLALTAVHGYST